MKKRLIMLAVILVVCMLVVVGCGDAEETVESEMLDEAVEVVEPGTVTVTDQMGREVTVVGIPERIISLSPSNTEIIFALGLGDRLVGVTEYCNYPAEAQKKEIIGNFANPSLERIVGLEPDLVLASTLNEKEVPQLGELGIPVLVMEPTELFELFASISLVAEITGVTSAGEALIVSMQQRIQAIEEIVAVIAAENKVRVYYEVYSDPLMSAGQDAFINEIISLAGGINIFGDINENYPQISAEVVAEKQPQVILYPDYHGTVDMTMEAMANRPGWESMPAVMDNQIYAISDDIFSRPGPRVVEAVEAAARLFYPELFN